MTAADTPGTPNPVDPRPLYTRATAQAAELIATVRPEQLEGPTPCTEYDVRTLLSHIVGGTHRIAVCGEQGDGLDVQMFADGSRTTGGRPRTRRSGPGSSRPGRATSG